MQINSLFHILLVLLDTPWWWSRVRPKHVGD